MSSQPDHDALADLFFAGPLASHVGTLEELDIADVFEGPWCLGEHNISAISSCSRLKQLGMHVLEADLPKAHGAISNSEVEMARNQPNIVVRFMFIPSKPS